MEGHALSWPAFLNILDATERVPPLFRRTVNSSPNLRAGKKDGKKGDKDDDDEDDIDYPAP